jgi:hypothetical protein
MLELNLSGVQKALQFFERDGLIASGAAVRTRLFQLNPLAFAHRELECYLDRLLESETVLRGRAAALRRRPRRTGKPL